MGRFATARNGGHAPLLRRAQGGPAELARLRLRREKVCRDALRESLP
jgi:hypothetical protein